MAPKKTPFSLSRKKIAFVEIRDIDQADILEPRRIEEPIRHMLQDIIHKLSKEKKTSIKSIHSSETTPEGHTISHIQLVYRKAGAAKNEEPESIKFTGPPSETAVKSENVTAHRAIKHLEKVFEFDYKDANYEEMVFWRDLYLETKGKFEEELKEYRELLEDYVALRKKIDEVNEREKCCDA